MPPSKVMTFLKTFVHDLRTSVKLAADTRSRIRLSMDFALSRLNSVIPSGQRNRLREVRLRGEVKILYRLNKGDLHSIREIWLEEAYRLPFEDPSGVFLDLGANIGMTSVWLAKRFSFSQVIAVEPDPGNAALARQNFELNGIAGHVLEAAIGPQDGTARFKFTELSNLGRLSEDGSWVPVISVGTLMKMFKVERFGLIKIDIEGGEQELFDGPIGWLASADAIIIEFHPTIVDYPRLIRLVSCHGFRYIPARSASPTNMDCFVRVK